MAISQIVLFDAIDLSQIPAGPAAVGAYVDGAWPTAAAAAARFPHARILTIAVSAEHDAEALDVETGDAKPADIPGWHKRQQPQVQRPCLYASVELMQAEVIPVLKAAGIPRGAVRLWTAHYAGKHTCGPSTCGELSTDADGTQWTDRAFGRQLDQSSLAADFFSTVPAPQPAPAPVLQPQPEPAPKPPTEDEMPSGVIQAAPGTRETHSWPLGAAAQVVLRSDWEGVQADPPVVILRIARGDGTFADVGTITVAANPVYDIPDPPSCNGCSFDRADAGPATVAFHTNPPA